MIWQFYSHQGLGYVHLVLSSSAGSFCVVIHMTPSSVTFHIPTSRKGKREGGGQSSFLKGMAYIPHLVTWPQLAAREAGKYPGSMAMYSAKKQDLLTDEEENRYWVKVHSLLLVCLERRMQEEENKVRDVGRDQTMGVLCSLR